MTLANAVWPGLLTRLQSLVNVPPQPGVDYPAQGWGTLPALKGVSEGEQLSGIQTPWAWLVNEDADRTQEVRGGSDQENTEYHLIVRLLAESTNDPAGAEHILMALQEQIAGALRSGIKLGQPYVRVALLTRLGWGYVPIDGIFYRTCECTVTVFEKMPVNYQP